MVDFQICPLLLAIILCSEVSAWAVHAMPPCHPAVHLVVGSPETRWMGISIDMQHMKALQKLGCASGASLATHDAQVPQLGVVSHSRQSGEELTVQVGSMSPLRAS
jgi:hypothetical protein